MTTQDLFSRTFAAVIFDNEGTLADSTRSAQRSWVQWAREHEVDHYSLVGHHGMPAAAIIESVAPHLDPVVALARIEELEIGDVAGVVALPGASHALAAARLREAGIAAPAGLVAVADVERGKPDPEPFLLAVTTTCIPGELADADLVVESLAQVGFDLSDGRVRLT